MELGACHDVINAPHIEVISDAKPDAQRRVLNGIKPGKPESLNICAMINPKLSCEIYIVLYVGKFQKTLNREFEAQQIVQFVEHLNCLAST